MKPKILIPCGAIIAIIFFMFTIQIHALTFHDFLVNPDSLEDIPHFYSGISFDSSGNFVIVWCDRGLEHNNRQIYFQRFDSFGNRAGNPVLVSDTNILSNNSPSIAMSPSGYFVITWGTSVEIDEDYIMDIWAMGFDSLGQPTWSRQQVDVDRTDPESVDSYPSVALDSGGNFVIVWQTVDSTGRNVFAQLFDASGEKIGNNFLVSDTSASNHRLCCWFTQYPYVTFNPQGYFFICWTGCVMCKPASPVTPLARIYDPSGTPKTKVFPFFAPCSSKWDYGSFPDLASSSEGNFIVTFNANDTMWTYPNNGVWVQTFDTLGIPLDSARIVNDVIDLVNIWHAPRIAVDSSDGYVILWSDWRTGTNRNLWAQRFIASGEPQGENYRINIPPGSLSSPDGEYADWYMYKIAIHQNTVGISWVDYRNWETFNTDIYAKLLDLNAIGIYLPGDVILDGIVDTIDLVYIVNYLFRSGSGLLPGWTGDVNASGEVTISDVVYLVNYLYKNGPPPQKPMVGSE
ncbi:MAG: dockerin type I repeat-containing protein [Candidatus Zixiibacteriota bacterium]